MQLEHENTLQKEKTDTDKLFAIIDEYIPSYFRSFFVGKRSLLVQSRVEYAKDLTLFLTFLTLSNPMLKDMPTRDIPVEVFQNLDVDDFNEYITWLENYELDNCLRTNGASSQGRKVSALRTIFKYLQERKYISNNPTILVEVPRPAKNMVIYFDREQKLEFLNFIMADTHAGWTKRQELMQQKIKYRDYAIFMTFFGTGLRISELTGIDLDDVDFAHETIYVHRKGNYNDQVYFGEEVSAALLDYVELERCLLPSAEDEKALFLSQKGSRITDRAIEIRMDTYCDSLFGKGNHFSPHKCRATYATELYQMYGDVRVVADALNHASLETSKHYVDSKEVNKRKGASMKIL